MTSVPTKKQSQIATPAKAFKAKKRGCVGKGSKKKFSQTRKEKRAQERQQRRSTDEAARIAAEDAVRIAAETKVREEREAGDGILHRRHTLWKLELAASALKKDNFLAGKSPELYLSYGGWLSYRRLNASSRD